jgi:AraC-like DNA-binding protein
MQNIFETIFLLAGIQGLLLTFILYSKKENHKANLILAIATFAMSLDLFTKIYYTNELFYQYPHFIGVTYPFPFLYGPLFFLYTKYVSKQEENTGTKELLHFLPAIIVFLIGIPVYFSTGDSKIEFVKRMISFHEPLQFKIIDWLIPFQGIFYTILTIKVVIDYNNRIQQNFSNIEKINLNWLKYLAYGAAVIWSIVVIIYLVGYFYAHETGIDFMLQLSMSILIYSMGYFGLNQPEIFLRSAEIVTDEYKSQKYIKSGLDDSAAEVIKNKLLDLMQNKKPYLDSELTLAKLSEMLEVSGHNLSEVMNTKLNQNYYDLINKYRVEEFKARISNPEYVNYTLLGIAYDSGFKSKTSFNTIFKKFSGLTPSDYKSSVIK